MKDTHFLATRGRDKVTTQKEYKQARDTHFLKSREGGTSQGMKRTQVSISNSLPERCKEKNKSGQGKNASE